MTLVMTKVVLLLAVAATLLVMAFTVSSGQAFAGKQCPAQKHTHNLGQIVDYPYKSLHISPNQTKFWWKEKQNWSGGATYRIGTNIC